ncbi:MAG: transglycosylase SLT domain-containing protein, partial [Candidatus Aenigmarchaeota archaeon]|nr:transglycosylase SLT domain-containing protein [Candidatus Aenigmarchaeota archaeon]
PPPAPHGYPTSPVASRGPHYLPRSHFVVKILHPDPKNPENIPLHQEASSRQFYHEKTEFDCEITGGRGPFQCKWEVSVAGSQWQHFWPYDPDGAQMGWSDEFPGRDYKFFKGGLDRIRNNFHYVQPLNPRQMDDPWASLPQGSYRVKVTVRDVGSNREAFAETTFSVGGLIPESDYFRAKITKPVETGKWKEIELHTDISTGERWHEVVEFGCETFHGVTPYTYVWRIDGNVVWNGTGDRYKNFSRGGHDHPVADLSIPFASLDEGRHTISLTVVDHRGTTAGPYNIALIVTRKARGKMRVVITNPAPGEMPSKEGEKPKKEEMFHTDIKKSPTTGDEYHDPISFDCEVSGGSGNYDYKWTALGLDNDGNPVTNEIPLNFVSRKNFSKGGPTHPVENEEDPEASFAEGLYEIRVVVTDINNPAETAEASTWIRIGTEQGPTTRSLASYIGMRPRAAPIGARGPLTGYASGPRGSLVRRQTVTGMRDQEGRGIGRALRESTVHRIQHPFSGAGRLTRVIKDEPKEGTDIWGSETKRGTIRTNPAVQTAINQGKRELNRWARQLFSPEFQRLQRELRTLTDNWRRRRNEWRDVRRRVRQRVGAGRTFWNYLKAQGGADALTNAIATAQQRAGSGITEAEARLLTNDVNQAYNRFTKAEEELMNFSYKRAAELRTTIDTKMKELAGEIAGRVNYRFKLSKVDGAETAVKAELELEAAKISKSLIERGKDTLSGPVGMLRSTSMRMKTFGSAYFGLKDYLWQIITAPWMWGFAFALVQFYFISMYIGFNPTYLWVFPAITAGFTFLVNFADTTRPFDWFNHLASGAIIGYSAVLLMMALSMNTFLSNTMFWVVWAVFSFIGIFQFYHTGGFRIVLQLGVIILLFAYLALGPYSGYYHQVIDQVKGPVEVAYRAVYKSVSDVYLLATNPTEWYARQQVQNVRPERALSLAKGVEVNTFDALPASVPSGQQFAITTVLKHEGTLNETRNIRISFSCNQWCDTKGIVPTNKDVKSTGLNIYQLIDSRTEKPHALKKGESVALSFSGFTASSIKGRENEYRVAKVRMNITYTYSTSSSLFAEVINSYEFEKRTNEGKNFRPVQAIGKDSPAQLSLNVGPQPLLAGKGALLLVAISNSRDESSVILPEGSEVIIRMPRSVGSGLDCEGFTHDSTNDGDPKETGVEVIRYRVYPRGSDRVEIKSGEFNTIFPFICSFTTNELMVNGRQIDEPTVQTGLITGEIPAYEFTTTKEKDVTITVPLGIIYDPYDSVCRQCGESVGVSSADTCNTLKCHSLSSDKGKCYFDYSKRTPDIIPGTDRIDPRVNMPFSTVCFSCTKDPTCEQFGDPTTCEQEDDICGIPCRWEGGSTTTTGKCLKMAAKNAPASIKSSDCTGLNEKEVNGYNAFAEVIRTSVAESSIEKTGYNAAAIISAMISQESMWRPEAVSPCGAAGIAQFTPDTAKNKNLLENYVLSVPSYDWSDHYCGARQINMCNSVTLKSSPSACNFNPQQDQRFDAEKSIRAMVKFMNGNVEFCTQGGTSPVYSNPDAIILALKAYKAGRGGECNGGENPDESEKYALKITKERYPKWVSCFAKYEEEIASGEGSAASRLTLGAGAAGSPVRTGTSGLEYGSIARSQVITLKQGETKRVEVDGLRADVNLFGVWMDLNTIIVKIGTDQKYITKGSTKTVGGFDVVFEDISTDGARLRLGFNLPGGIQREGSVVHPSSLTLRENVISQSESIKRSDIIATFLDSGGNPMNFEGTIIFDTHRGLFVPSGLIG